MISPSRYAGALQDTDDATTIVRKTAPPSRRPLPSHGEVAAAKAESAETVERKDAVTDDARATAATAAESYPSETFAFFPAESGKTNDADDDERDDSSVDSVLSSGASTVDSAFSMVADGVQNEEYMRLCDRTDVALEGLSRSVHNILEWHHVMAAVMGLPANVQRRVTILLSQLIRAGDRINALGSRCTEYLRKFSQGLVLHKEVLRLEREMNRRAR